MKENYLGAGDGFIILYSITSKDSLREALTWYEELIRYRQTKKLPIVLVGNKCDLEDQREVAEEEGRTLAKHWKVPFFETSVRGNKSILLSPSNALKDTIFSKYLKQL
jgi:GTPase KRas protein